MLNRLKKSACKSKTYFGLEKSRSNSNKRRRLMSEGITREQKDEQNGVRIRAPPKLKNPKSCSDLKKIFFSKKNEDQDTIRNDHKGDNRLNIPQNRMEKKQEQKRFLPMMETNPVYSKTLDNTSGNLDGHQPCLTQRALVTHNLIKKIQEKTGRAILTSNEKMALLGKFSKVHLFNFF